jgi:hypothetical protein
MNCGCIKDEGEVRKPWNRCPFLWLPIDIHSWNKRKTRKGIYLYSKLVTQIISTWVLRGIGERWGKILFFLFFIYYFIYFIVEHSCFKCELCSNVWRGLLPKISSRNFFPPQLPSPPQRSSFLTFSRREYSKRERSIFWLQRCYCPCHWRFGKERGEENGKINCNQIVGWWNHTLFWCAPHQPSEFFCESLALLPHHLHGVVVIRCEAHRWSTIVS